jgi:hypothetical protein
VAGFVAIAAFMGDPAVGNPMVAGTLVLPVAVDPDVLMATIGPIPGCPDVTVTRGWYFTDAGGGRSNLDVDQGSGLGQGHRG